MNDVTAISKRILQAGVQDAKWMEIEEGQPEEGIVYGNEVGRDLLDSIKKLMESLEKMEGTVDEASGTDGKKADLKHRLDLVIRSCKGYRRIRHRFLEVYRRDIMGSIYDDGYKKIEVGNQAAHHGDAIIDAALYLSGERVDEHVLVNVYGLSAYQIHLCCKCQTYVCTCNIVTDLCSSSYI